MSTTAEKQATPRELAGELNLIIGNLDSAKHLCHAIVGGAEPLGPLANGAHAILGESIARLDQLEVALRALHKTEVRS